MKIKTKITAMLFSISCVCIFASSANAAFVIPVTTAEMFVMLAEAENEQTVRLDADITLSDNVFIFGKFDLDLNGHTLSVGSKTLVTGEDSDVVIRDNSTAQTGKISSTSGFVIQNGSSAIPNPKLTIESGTISGGSYGVRNFGTFIMNGGTLTSNNFTFYSDNNSHATINGGLITNSNSVTIRVNTNVDITINGGTIENKGADGDGIIVNDGSKATVNGGKIIASGDKGAAIVAYKYTDTTINGGELIAGSFALAGNGSGPEGLNNEGTGAKFTITGGKLTSVNSTAIYAPQQQGVTRISGGELVGKYGGIEIRAGDLYISGGTITVLEDEYSVNDNTNGITTHGSAIAVVQHTTKQPINVHISGGTFNSTVPLSEANPLGNSPEDIAKITIRIDEENGIPTFNSTDPNMTIYSEDLSGFIYGGRYTQSIETYKADGFCEYIERSIGKTRVQEACEEEEREVAPVNPATFDERLIYFALFALSCLGLCGATASLNFRK